MSANKFVNSNPNFNFTNIVPQSNQRSNDRLSDMACNNNIMLEPRLQEYMKKKRYYKDNQIEPCITPEKEFQITPMDIRIMKQFLKGNRKIYDKKTYNKMLPKNCPTPRFPSEDFKDDPRVPKIEKSKQKYPCPTNRGMFGNENNDRHYEDPIEREPRMIDARDFPEMGRGFDLNSTRFNPRLDPKIDPGIEKHPKEQSQFYLPPNPPKCQQQTWPNNDPEESEYRLTSQQRKQQRQKHTCEDATQDLRNKYMVGDLSTGNRQYLPDDNGKFEFVDKTDYTGDSYCAENAPTYGGVSEMDLDNKMVIPSVGSKSRRDMGSNNYRLETYFAPDNKRQKRDTEVEADLIRGMPSYRPKNKSYGYRNPDENYFDYIDEDFRYDSVEPWERGGIATRLDNKSLAKNRKYEREIM